MRSPVRELFSFTTAERNGTVVLLIVFIFLTVFVSLQKMFISLPKEDFTAFDAFIAQLKEKNDSTLTQNAERETQNPEPINRYEEAGQHSVYHTRELFNFDPNGLSVDDWVRLGLSPAQARSVKNFEAKGGKFECKEDVKKLFVISAERYNELEPYIVLPDKKIQISQTILPTTNRQPPTPVIVELNTADSSLLTTINGIGPVFASRILSYRERLGGFHSKEQLLEVFGMDAEKFAGIKEHVKADSTYIRKININTAQVSDLKKMPYFSPATANALVSYRKAHGNFKSVEGIRACALITEELYRKIAPYLTI